MKNAYGILTTDGESVAGTLHDEYALNLAERLDESTASLYISTKNGVLLLGTAINVQKQGRRPDTFIYLEKIGWNGELLPEIDLSFIHAFYARVERRLSEIDYEVRDIASDDDFFDERNRRVITGLLHSHVADYSVGRLLLGKEVVCVSGDLSKSVDFVIAVTEKLHHFLSSGFTIVVAKRTFRNADLLVTEKSSGAAHIDLASERTADRKWEEMYRNIGIFAQNPVIRQKIAKEKTREIREKRLLSEYAITTRALPGRKERFAEFVAEENIGASAPPSGAFSASAYEQQAKGGVSHPKESDYGKWKINDSDREHLRQEYEEHMKKKKKAKIRLLAVLVVFMILLAAVLVLFVFNSGSIPPGQNTTEIPHITPSGTIEPGDMSLILTRLNTTPGNIPDNMSGFGSAYEIIVSQPRNVSLNLNADYNPELSYYLMRYNESASAWVPVNTTLVVGNISATAFIPDSGIYRLFTDRESSLNTS